MGNYLIVVWADTDALAADGQQQIMPVPSVFF